MTWLLGQIGLALLLALIAGWFLGWYLRAFRDQDKIEDLRQTMLATKDVKERELNECRRRVEELEAERAAGPSRVGSVTAAATGGAQAQPIAAAEVDEEPVGLRAVAEPDLDEDLPEPEPKDDDDLSGDDAESPAGADAEDEKSVGDDIAEDATLLGTEESLKWTLPYSEDPPHVAAAERERRREAEEALRRKTAAVLSLQAELEALKEATSGKASEIAALEDRLASAEAASGELEAVQSRVRESEARVERHQADADEARREAGRRSEELAALRQEMAARDTRLNELRNRCAELETAIQATGAEPGDAGEVPTQEIAEMRRALQRQIERNRKQEAVHRAVVEQLEADKAALRAVPPEPAPAAPAVHSDELSQIRGIGPGFAKALREAGVETFAQIGRWNQDDIERVASLLGTHAKRIHNDRWIEQARALDRDR